MVKKAVKPSQSQSAEPVNLRSTRGSGLLEPFLARLRAQQANRLVPKHLRQGRILDLGCGSFPYFLSHTEFQEKFAVDRHANAATPPTIQLYTLDLNVAPQLPFPNEFFNVVTMLAVVEHLNPASLVVLLREVQRTLRPGGQVIITTPAAWSASLLHTMARVNLVSVEEIREHQFSYTLPLLGWYFGSAGFVMERVRFGYFELWLNMWATAERE
jgi:SAM-dependent methyltransferase